MKLEFQPMDKDRAHAIAGWHYGGRFSLRQDLSLRERSIARQLLC